MKKNIYSVSQVNDYVNKMLREDLLCSSISIKGELINVCVHKGSGHVYFSLKDGGAVISCVLFAGYRRGLKFKMEDGVSVIASGELALYSPKGTFQLKANKLEPEGQGEEYEKYLKLKKELEEMGMFDESYKRKIPRYVKRLGVVTSGSGAAIGDILAAARRKNPYVEIILYPANVQGEHAIENIVNGIKHLEEENVDVMIVGRGGGSNDDLWVFNDRAVAEAVFNCSIPVISAVGHERDIPIIDLVADYRASTPTMAGDTAVCDVFLLLSQIEDYQERLSERMTNRLKRERMTVEKYDLKLQKFSPDAVTERYRMRIQNIERQLTARMENKLLVRKNKLSLNATKLESFSPLIRTEKYRRHILSVEDELSGKMEKKLLAKKNDLRVGAAKLESLSPLAKLRQGYSYIQTADGKTLTDAKQVNAGDAMKIYLQNGTVDATVERVRVGGNINE